tara:strand:- start:825 stop:938 length:114 start_codon:yes stop_codon:yes gene_type:complete
MPERYFPNPVGIGLGVEPDYSKIMDAVIDYRPLNANY